MHQLPGKKENTILTLFTAVYLHDKRGRSSILCANNVHFMYEPYSIAKKTETWESVYTQLQGKLLPIQAVSMKYTASN